MGHFFALLAYRKVLTPKENLPGCGEGLQVLFNWVKRQKSCAAHNC